MVNVAQFAALVLVALTIVGCGKKVEEKPKTADQLQSEKVATDKMVRDNPVYGDHIKALDTAKEMQKAAEAQAAETAKKSKIMRCVFHMSSGLAAAEVAT